MQLRTFGHIVPVFGLIGVVACGGSSNSLTLTTPSAPTLSQGDVSHITTAVQPALAQAFSGLGTALTGVHGATVGAGTVRPASQAINAPINSQVPCADSGVIVVAGNISGVLADDGSGSERLSMQVTFTNCLSSGILLQGNPNISLTGQFTFASFQPVTPVTFQIAGGILFVLNNVQGSVAYHCTDSINVTTGAVSSSGSITFEYPVGTTATIASCFGS